MTAAEWFAQLDEPYRSAAIEAIDEEWQYQHYHTITQALSSGFNWLRTPGIEMSTWANLHRGLIDRARATRGIPLSPT